MKKQKTMELKYVIAIAIATLIVGAIIGLSINFSSHNSGIKISGNDLELIEVNNGAYQYAITYPNNQISNSKTHTIKIHTGENEFEIMNCEYVKNANSEYEYICEPEESNESE